MTQDADHALVLLYQVPSSTSADRQFILRRLQAIEAEPMIQGAWSLPNSPSNRRKLEQIAAFVQGRRGVSYVIAGAAHAVLDGRKKPSSTTSHDG